jgi:hypothetical protein
MPRRLKARWKIRGYKSTELVFDKTLPGGYTNGEIKTLLQRLACRDLNADEIFAASLRRRGGRGYLEPHIDGPPHGKRLTIWLDSGMVSYIAGYWKADEPD